MLSCRTFAVARPAAAATHAGLPAKPPVKLRWSALALASGLSLLLAAGAGAQPADAASAAPAASAASVPAVAPVAWPEDGLDVERADRLKGLKKVALAGVSLYVLTENGAGATAGAAGHGSMVAVNTSMKVVGLDTARLQALADRVYDQAVAALTARGIEVLPHAQLQALPAYQALQAVGKPSPMPLDAPAGKGWVLGARGLPVIHLGELSWLNRAVGGMFGAKVSDPYISMSDAMSAGFGMGKLNQALNELTQATGTPLAMVRVVLSPAQVKAQGGAFSFGASTSVRNSLLMPTWTNRILIRTQEGDYGRVSLKKPLISETGLGELVDVTSAGTTAANVAVTMLTHLAALSGTGRGTTQNSREMELRTSNEVFEAVAWPQISTSLTGLAAGLTP